MLLGLCALDAGCAGTPDGGAEVDPSAEGTPADDQTEAPADASTGSTCATLIADANQAYGNGDAANALALLDTAWAQCGDGHDILEMKAVLVAVGGDPEGAAELVLEEIADPPLSEGAFALLGQLMPSLSDATRAKIQSLGNTPDGALHAPSMRAEYTWATEVVCDGEEPESFGQGTMQHGGKTVELLTFDCPGGASHDVYFYPPPDPLEQMFEERLDE